jgi:hypothetical protein
MKNERIVLNLLHWGVVRKVRKSESRKVRKSGKSGKSESQESRKDRKLETIFGIKKSATVKIQTPLSFRLKKSNLFVSF